MPDPQSAEFIANTLRGGLIWPGNDRHPATPIPLPTFHTANIPPAMLQHFADEANLPHGNIAQLTGEALVHSLETAGKTIVDTAELDRLRALDAAHEVTRRREVTLECICGAKVCSSAMTEVNANKFQIQGNRFIAALQQLSAECAVGHQPASS